MLNEGIWKVQERMWWCEACVKAKGEEVVHALRKPKVVVRGKIRWSDGRFTSSLHCGAAGRGLNRGQSPSATFSAHSPQQDIITLFLLYEHRSNHATLVGCLPVIATWPGVCLLTSSSWTRRSKTRWRRFFLHLSPSREFGDLPS